MNAKPMLSKTSLRLLLILLYLLLFLPFWKEMLLAAIFAFAINPVFRKLKIQFGAARSRLAYFSILGIAILALAAVAVATLQIYSLVVETVTNQEVMKHYASEFSSLKDSIAGWASQQSLLEKYRVSEKIRAAGGEMVPKVASYALSIGGAVVAAAPDFIFRLALFLAALASFLVLGESIVNTGLSHIFRVPKENFPLRAVEEICGLVLSSVLLVGGIQSVIVTVGALVAGYSAAFPVFLATFIFSLIPVLGAGLMAALLALFAVVKGDYGAAVVLGITALLAGSIDNILRPFLFSRAAKTNPVLSLISLLGGIALFGFAGLFFAPVLEQSAMRFVFQTKSEDALEEA